jgi:hypothetical protein
MTFAMGRAFGIFKRRSFWLRYFLVTVIAIALGSLFSFAQESDQPSPFNRFLDGVKLKKLDSATVRFAAECGVNLSLTKVVYADRPGDKWNPVADLSKGLDDMATDFFGTAAMWKQGNRLVVELWDIEGDVGSEARGFYCFDGDKATQAENIEWTLPVTDEEEKGHPGWGYEQRWTVGANGKYQKTLSRFVNPQEDPISKPKLEAGEEPNYNWTPKILALADLELPTELLK